MTDQVTGTGKATIETLQRLLPPSTPTTGSWSTAETVVDPHGGPGTASFCRPYGLFFPQSPKLFWPSDHAWCVAFNT